MKCTLLAASCLLVVLAPAANATVSVSFAADSSTYLPGGTITLTFTVTANGGETDATVYGLILYDQSKVTPGTRTQVGLPPGDWTQGALNCSSTRCVAFSQVHVTGFALTPTAINVTNLVIATMTYTVNPSIPIDSWIWFGWVTSPSGQRLDFFGVTSAQPEGVCITAMDGPTCPIPEPGPAALLALGLAGLALARSRRR